eukprot:55884_1
MAEVCWDSGNDTNLILTDVPFYHFAIVLPIIICFQIFILCHSCYRQCRCFHVQNSENRIFTLLSHLFFALQFSGILYNISDFIKQVILSASVPHWVHDHVLCIYFGYADKLIPFIYELLFLSILTFRLELAFKNIATSHKKWLLRLLVLLSVLVFLILFLIFLPSPCIVDWHPMDYSKQMKFCMIDIFANDGSMLVAVVGMGWLVILNILFGFLFFCQLRFLAGDPSINNIMIKVVILTLFAVCSTVVLWALFFSVPAIGDIFIWLDYFLNVFFISLMFKYNDKYYAKLCGPCIRTTDKSLNLPNTDFMTNEIEFGSRTDGMSEQSEL